MDSKCQFFYFHFLDNLETSLKKFSNLCSLRTTSFSIAGENLLWVMNASGGVVMSTADEHCSCAGSQCCADPGSWVRVFESLYSTLCFVEK